MAFLLGDCLELVACKLPRMTWTYMLKLGKSCGSLRRLISSIQIIQNKISNGSLLYNCQKLSFLIILIGQRSLSGCS